MDTRDGRIYSVEQVAVMGRDDQSYMRPMAYGPTPAQRASNRIGRNDPCPCGSGRKFKKCCIWRSKG